MVDVRVQIFFFDNFLSNPNHFVKQFIGGALVAITMTIQTNRAQSEIKDVVMRSMNL